MAINKSKNFKLKTIILISLIAIIAVTGFIFKQNVLAEYDYYFNFKHFNRGDKVYLIKQSMEQRKTSWPLFYLVRPLTKQDIEDDKNINEAEKVSRIDQLDPSLKPYLIEDDLGFQFEIDTLHKYKTACVGSFLYRKVLNIQDSKTKKYYKINVYAIKIHYPGYFEGLTDDNGNYLPEGYALADKTIYYPAAWLTDEEYSAFKK